MTLKIKRKRIDGSVERQFLTGAVVSGQFLKEARSFYDPKLLESNAARTVAEWCFKYHKRYDKAPGEHIKDLFAVAAERMEKAERDQIADLLAGISDEYERADKLNVPYLLDQTEKHFQSLSLAALARNVNGLVSEGDVENAQGLLSGYKLVGRPQSMGENPFKSMDTIQSAFDQSEQPLFTFRGPLGKMMNPVLGRDQFISFMGPEKRGKTWMLNEVAIRAALARCNVALFQIGDMSLSQIVVRLCVRLARRSNLQRYADGDVEVPVPDCRKNQEGSCDRCKHRNKPIMDEWKLADVVDAFRSGDFDHHVPCTRCANESFFKGSLWYEQQHVKKPLSWREAWRLGKKFLGRTRGHDFKLSVHPSDQLSVSGMKIVLDNWEAFEGFIPDVVVIDYADNLAPENRREEYRHQQNQTWKMLRGLSLERHCLVATATQASAASYDTISLSMKHFSEDKRKFAHVTGMFGLNQTPAEKRAGIMRINTIVARESEFHVDEEVHVAQSLQTGQPMLFSF